MVLRCTVCSHIGETWPPAKSILKRVCLCVLVWIWRSGEFWAPNTKWHGSREDPVRSEESYWRSERHLGELGWLLAGERMHNRVLLGSFGPQKPPQQTTQAEDRGMLSVSVWWHGKLWSSTKERSTCLHFCSWTVFSRRPLESLSVQLACCSLKPYPEKGERVNGRSNGKKRRATDLLG